MGLVIDTSAWIEFFRASQKGGEVKNQITMHNEILTPTIVLAEMRHSYVRDGLSDDDFRQDLMLIKKLSVIVDLDEETAIAAGYKRATIGVRGISYQDCILIETAEKFSFKVISTDPHFKNIPNALYLH
jgi:predicted nucleic acid-binding protein